MAAQIQQFQQKAEYFVSQVRDTTVKRRNVC